VKAALYDPSAAHRPSRQRGLSTKRKHPHIYNRTSHRLREIERIIGHRYGVVPDTDDADIILDQVACCILRILWKKTGRKPDHAELVDRLNLWCERWADKTSIHLRWDVVREVLRRPRLDCADECAAQLRLSYDERTLLGITTIGSYDVDKRGRAKRRKARKLIRDRERAAKKRAERGAVPRAQYLATSLSATKPWIAQGISRRTWERRRRASFFDAASIARRHDASPSPSSTASMLGDTPASPVAHVREISIFLAHPLSSRHSRHRDAISPRRGQRAAHAGPRIHAGDKVERGRFDDARH
jgi:hypothetical protein